MSHMDTGLNLCEEGLTAHTDSQGPWLRRAVSHIDIGLSVSEDRLAVYTIS